MKAKNKQKTIRATTARHNFQEIIDTVHYTEVPVIITKYDKPWVMITPVSKKHTK